MVGLSKNVMFRDTLCKDSLGRIDELVPVEKSASENNIYLLFDSHLLDNELTAVIYVKYTLSAYVASGCFIRI